VIVAIDGPAGAGKSTVAREVARRLGAAYLDTGAMYRALAWLALERAVASSDGEALAALAREHPVEIEPTDDGDRVRVAGRDVTAEIRTPAVAAEVSEVSAHPGVRAEMVAAQRALMARGDWVSDGRDVGSVVRPDADVKVFLTASPQERARRRRAELAARGVELDEDHVLKDVLRRDELDSTRPASPLVVAPGAVVIDSSGLDASAVADRVMSMIAELVG
jgi:cytidylate kinase